MLDQDQDQTTLPVIFVVDDTAQNVELLTRLLRNRGYDPRPFDRGRPALESARSQPPDLVLLDIDMPEMTGFEVCAQMKAEPALKDTPVIFISAFDSVSDKVKAFSSGGVDYVTKPFQFDEVAARVRTHLELRRQRLVIERQKQEQEASCRRLEELERLRDDLVQMLVHDMRSPLMALMGRLDLALTDPDSLPPELLEDLQACMKAAHGLNDMVSAILDVSRLEAGQMPIQPVPSDLGKVVSSALESIAALTVHHELRYERPPQPVLADCDPQLIERVVVNMVANAVKFTPHGGAVRIAAALHDGQLRVEVTDSGPGIPAADRQRIFDKFAQLEARRERKKYSTGLGLTFCKLAVERQGGRIGVSSEPGHGSTFWFELPPAAG